MANHEESPTAYEFDPEHILDFGFPDAYALLKPRVLKKRKPQRVSSKSEPPTELVKPKLDFLDDQDEETVELSRTILLNKILDLFNEQKINTIKGFLAQLSDIISYSAEHKVEIKLRALKERPSNNLVSFGTGETSTAHPHRIKATADEVTEFTIEDFVRLRDGLAKKWAALEELKQFSREKLPARSLVNFFKLALREIKAEQKLSAHEFQDLDSSHMTLRKRLFQIMCKEFALKEEEEKIET